MKNENVCYMMFRYFCLSCTFVIGLVAIVGSGGGGGGGSGGGGDGSDSSGLSPVKVGSFVDSVVGGIQYETNTLKGTTNSEGEFNYREGENIRFFIGDVLLGQACVHSTLTPVDLVNGANDESDQTVTNMCRFLQSLDVDGDPENGIYISPGVRNEIEGRNINFLQSITAFENDPDVQALFDTLNALRAFDSEIETTLVSAIAARDHMRKTLNQVSSTIGPEGGQVEVTVLKSPVYGAKLTIPPNALDTEENISLSYTNMPGSLSGEYVAAGECINFAPAGISFGADVKIFLPYKDQDNDGIIDGMGIPESSLVVKYFNESSRQWEDIEVLSQDTNKNIIEARTNHFSTYLVLRENDEDDDEDDDELESGDYFIGVDNNTNGTNSNCCNPYDITILGTETGLTYVIDRTATFGPGYPITPGADYTDGTFDAVSIFSKVSQSGDAQLWDWECEFVSELTYLVSYYVVDDELVSVGGDGIPCECEALDSTTVRVDWGIDVRQEIAVGNMFVISFEATYQ